MGVLFNYIREFYKNTFHAVYFFLILLLVGLLIYGNYGHSLEIRLAKGRWGSFAGYYCLFFIPYALAFLLQPLFYKDCGYFRNPWFWAILFMAPLFFTTRIHFNLQEVLVSRIWKGDERYFWIRSINWVVRVFVVLLPVYLLWLIKDRNDQPFYGTRAMKNFRPYLIMLLIMLPLIALASTQNDFLAVYPRARIFAGMDLPSKALHYFIYELCYGFDFVSIEFFFRGFLILSLAKICGPKCILPAACFYCTIHFGKPMGEAISSFWGGLFLGIVSFNTGSVWGGLIAHLGIAWMMEGGGWLGMLLKK